MGVADDARSDVALIGAATRIAYEAEQKLCWEAVERQLHALRVFARNLDSTWWE